MSTELPLSVLFLWHQHQPFYKDPLSNRYEMPWVRLHATKDYYDMVALLDEFPKIRANFNLVPGMLAQLDDYAQGKAHDKFLALSLKEPSQLSFEERLFILQNFFMANRTTMVEPYPRYRDLLEKRGRSTSTEELSRIQTYFKDQDWRDLQVWFNLVWIDPLWQEREPFIAHLHAKAQDFTEEEKAHLLELQKSICGQVVAKHRELLERGQIELTTSPFYHPILPLLIDTAAAQMALPSVQLPKEHFAYPQDARCQIETAIDDHTRRFGQKPQGMWPSEGSVSEAAARLIADCGVRWIATDEAILAQSIFPSSFDHDDLYEPYQFQTGENTLKLFFRDHELSDAIGFIYAGWDPKVAVQDLIDKLHAIHERTLRKDDGTPRPHVVSIILDGENCWEYYRQDGLPFLRELYRRLSDDPTLTTVRGSDYLDHQPDMKTLPRLASGSWINGNFAIWIGHPEDNQAWDLLFQTRQFLTHLLETRPELVGTDAAKLAWEEIMIAEGSDWCWWYGDDHSSANDLTFDYLFRKHLMNVYSVMSVKPPEELHLPIKKQRAAVVAQPPTDFISPKIDGRVTGYYEWQAAGRYKTETGATGTMHRVQNLLSELYYGFDAQTLYFRLDLAVPLSNPQLFDYAFRLVFIQPAGIELKIALQPELQVSLTVRKATEPPRSVGTAAARKIIEIAVPLADLGVRNAPFELALVIERSGQEIERWPADSAITFPYPSPDVFAENWLI